MYVSDFILNGQPNGEMADALHTVRCDTGLLRPYLDRNGRASVVMNAGVEWDPKEKKNKPKYQKVLVKDLNEKGIYLNQAPITNALTLRKDEWIRLDQKIIAAARDRLRAWSDLAAANSYGGFDGMSKTILEHQTVSESGQAVQSMGMVADIPGDRPLWQLEGLPLPITQAGFWYEQRELIVSRNSGTPLSTISAEHCGRKVAELIENQTIGTVAGLTYGASANYSRTSAVYGYINFPNRLIKTDLTIPTGANPEATVADVLEMRQQLYDAKFHGPYMLYHSTDWDIFLDNDYARLGGSNANMTLRDRLRKIEGIQDVRRLDSLTPSNSHAFTMVMVQMTSDVAEAVNGLGITTVQWQEMGGAKLYFKVIAIQVPRLYADFTGNAGILHARTA